MKKLLWIVIGVVIAVIAFNLISDDDRAEMSDRISSAGKALTGDIRADGERTPRIVKEQQRKERIRQDSTWTPENRAAHPIEYCQAQLEELVKHGRTLEARIHEKSCALAALKRTMGDDEAMEKGLTKFLGEAKKSYRDALASNTWPVMMGGYSLSQEKAKQKIIDAAEKLSEIQSRTVTKKNQKLKIEKSLDIARTEQQRTVKYREQIQNTISDLKLKKVIEADDGIKAALDAICDNMGTLGVDYDDPSIESIIQPDSKATRDELFDKIMAE